MSRADVVAGYRAAADFLESHPSIPTGDNGNPLYVSVVTKTEAQNAVEVDRIAAVLGVTADYQAGSAIHYGCHFDLGGGLTYRAQTVRVAHLLPVMRTSSENKGAA